MAQQQPQGMPPLMPDGATPDMHGANYYPQEHSDITGGLPINLDSLRDGPPGSKPFYPYSTLIRYAIKGSPNQKLLLEDIYYAIESRFPYFRTAPNGWKNSVRHNLSLNPCFEKVPRPLTDRGKGSYWTVNDNIDPRTGVHRIRKKKTKSSKAAGRASEEPDVDYHPSEATFEDPNASFVPPLDDAAARQVAYPAFPAFDPNAFAMMGGMRFFPPMPMDDFPTDEAGNIDWRQAWRKEIGHLEAITQDAEKAQIDSEWYRMMLFRVRGALMPPIPPEAMNQMMIQAGIQPQHLAPPAPGDALQAATPQQTVQHHQPQQTHQ